MPYATATDAMEKLKTGEKDSAAPSPTPKDNKED